MDNSAYGNLLSGTEISKEIQEHLVQRVAVLGEKLQGFKPGLTIVQVGGREDSNVYIRTKMKSAALIGINAKHMRLPSSVSQTDLVTRIMKLNNDPSVHGIIVQMPLDSMHPIDPHVISDAVSPEKDVDGLNTINEGRVAVGDMSGFLPCTPQGIMELIKRSGVKITGSRAVILGRSKIVGTPAAELLKWENATVTICHSYTKDLEKQIYDADILIVAIGKPEFVKGSWIKKGTVVIDCGINFIPDETKKSGKRLVGDVDFQGAKSVASYITPVPGGVGPMTVAMLMSNTVKSAECCIDKLLLNSWSFTPLHLNTTFPVPSDIEISRGQEPHDINELAKMIGLFPVEYSLYGNRKAKLSLAILDRLKNREDGKYIVVAGITPTPLGEGKSTTTIGLVQALTAHVKVNSIACLRQPSQGPTFGIKGGAAGGGYSQIIPMEEFNLHLTGDIHAVSAANNLLAAQLDARIFHECTQKDKFLYSHLVPNIKGIKQFSKCQIRRLEKLGINKTDPDTLTEAEISSFSRLNIDPTTVTWKRVLDINDRYLRKITIGQSPTEKGFIRETSFQMAVASEVMAILALSKDLKDLKNRLSQIVVAYNKRGDPVTADDLGVTGAMTVLLKDAVEPTLMQTYEGTPVLVHAGPFADIAHGCSSIIADLIALKLVGSNGYVVTEAGFGSDIGMEKFMDIKCRMSGKTPNAVVLVTTVRALKMHGGGPSVIPGSPLSIEYMQENIDLLIAGLDNLKKHIENGNSFGVPVIVAINAHQSDTVKEHEIIKEASIRNGAEAAIVCLHWRNGGEGAINLAESVIEVCKKKYSFRYLYSLDTQLFRKMEIVAKEMYGAGSIETNDDILQKLANLEAKGYGNLPICVSKTSRSLTGNPAVKGAPKGFTVIISDVYLSAGAGFIVAVVGSISAMPGLPIRPSIFDIDFDTDTGLIEGLF